jgi:ElaB/YqjD/DUF883 family membrane-anchored ribosome-binding protein
MITERPGQNNGITGERTMRETQTEKAKAEETKLEGLRHMAAEKVSEARDYVRDRGIRGMASDVSDAAARHPIAAVGISLGLGYFVGRLMSRKH